MCACVCCVHANEGIEIVINVCDESTLGEQLGLWKAHCFPYFSLKQYRYLVFFFVFSHWHVHLKQLPETRQAITNSLKQHTGVTLTHSSYHGPMVSLYLTRYSLVSVSQSWYNTRPEVCGRSNKACVMVEDGIQKLRRHNSLHSSGFSLCTRFWKLAAEFYPHSAIRALVRMGK